MAKPTIHATNKELFDSIVKVTCKRTRKVYIMSGVDWLNAAIQIIEIEYKKRTGQILSNLIKDLYEWEALSSDTAKVLYGKDKRNGSRIP